MKHMILPNSLEEANQRQIDLIEHLRLIFTITKGKLDVFDPGVF